jgi:hypothetical protein
VPLIYFNRASHSDFDVVCADVPNTTTPFTPKAEAKKVDCSTSSCEHGEGRGRGVRDNFAQRDFSTYLYLDYI